MPRSNRSTSAGISANSGSSASLSNSSRATSASCRSTTTPVRSAVSMRALRNASFSCPAAARSALAARPPTSTCVATPHGRNLATDAGGAKTARPFGTIVQAHARSPSGAICGIDAKRTGPAEAVLGAAARAVFASHPARHTRSGRAWRKSPDSSPRPRPARGAGGTAAIWTWPTTGRCRSNRRDQIAADDLHMIEIELDADVRARRPWR